MANSEKNVKECIACKTTFIRQSDMIRHIKRFHSKNAENLISMMENKDSKFKCDQCDKQFSNRKNLGFHRKSHCGNITGVKIKKKCPLCDYIAAFKKDFYDHCGQAHNIMLDIEKMNFPSIDDFTNWKSEIEGAMNSKFIKEYGSTAKMTNFICNQSEYSGSDNEIGSSQDRKVNGFCPAGFRVMHEENGKCSIYFVKTHICYQNKNIFPNSTSNERLSDNSLEHENHLEGSLKNKIQTQHDDADHSEETNDRKPKQKIYTKKKDFLMKKKELMKNVLSILDTISNISELEVVQELINPIKPVLEILQAKSRDG